MLFYPPEGEDPIPKLIVSNGPSPVGSPVADRLVTTKRSLGQIGDVETADEGTIHHHSYGDNSSDKHYYSSKKAKTLSLLSPVVYLQLTTGKSMEFTLKHGVKTLRNLIQETHPCPMPSKLTVPLAWN